MAIVKNEIPILEFDTVQTAVLNPTHENLDLNLPKKCVFAFLGAYIDEYANKTDTKQVSTFVSATKHYPIYITKYKGEEIVLCQAPVGSAPATAVKNVLSSAPICVPVTPPPAAVPRKTTSPASISEPSPSSSAPTNILPAVNANAASGNASATAVR